MTRPTPEEQLLWDIFAKPEPEHRLIGSTCTCGDWSAGCGHNVPEQWRLHVALANQQLPPGSGDTPPTTPGS